jgi:hypothetical protein
MLLVTLVVGHIPGVPPAAMSWRAGMLMLSSPFVVGAPVLKLVEFSCVVMTCTHAVLPAVVRWLKLSQFCPTHSWLVATVPTGSAEGMSWSCTARSVVAHWHSAALKVKLVHALLMLCRVPFESGNARPMGSPISLPVHICAVFEGIDCARAASGRASAASTSVERIARAKCKRGAARRIGRLRPSVGRGAVIESRRR